MELNLEKSIKDVISKKLEDGTIEKLVGEQFEKGVNGALDNLFRSYGDVTKVIEEKIKETMVPYIEKYDYSKYTAKLDVMLIEILNNTTLDSKKIIENFRDLMIPVQDKTIKVSAMFEEYKKHVAANVNTDELEINYEDGPTYESVEAKVEFEEDDRKYGSFEHATLMFSCDHDDSLDLAVKMTRWPKYDNKWTLSYNNPKDIESLRRLSGFELFLIKLYQADVEIETDTEYDYDDVTPDKEPEATFS